MRMIFLIVIFCSANLFCHDVFDPVSRLIPKKQIYDQPVKRIFFYIHFISARYGKKFEDADVQKEFEKQEWYEINEDYHDSLLNDIDKQNIKNLTKIYNSLLLHVEQLKALESQIVWEKRVKLIENDATQKCIYTISKQPKGFKVNCQFKNKGGVFYATEYEVLSDDFSGEWNGYPTDGIYEAIAMNYEFVNIEFYPDERTEQSIKYWYEVERKMTPKQAQKIYSQLKNKIKKHKGETYFTGYLNDTLFPSEYIYLKEEKNFVLVYSP